VRAGGPRAGASEGGACAVDCGSDGVPMAKATSDVNAQTAAVLTTGSDSKRRGPGEGGRRIGESCVQARVGWL
jgi:hypothetical protein